MSRRNEISKRIEEDHKKKREKDKNISLNVNTIDSKALPDDVISMRPSITYKVKRNSEAEKYFNRSITKRVDDSLFTLRADGVDFSNYPFVDEWSNDDNDDDLIPLKSPISQNNDKIQSFINIPT